jgi:hypothetical protein
MYTFCVSGVSYALNDISITYKKKKKKKELMVSESGRKQRVG